MQDALLHIQQNPQDADAIAELIRKNEPLIRYCANRFLVYFELHGRGAADLDDLMQAGRVGMIDAARTYDPAAGKAWAGWAMWHLIRAMQGTLGYKHRIENGVQRSTPDPPLVCLDAPLSDDPEAACLVDLLPDDAAISPEEAAELSCLCRQVRDAVAALDADQAAIVTRHYLDGVSMERAGAEIGMSWSEAERTRRKAFRNLRHNRTMKHLHQDYICICYRKKGLRAFSSSGSSVVEDAVIRLMELEEKNQGITLPGSDPTV